MNIIELDNKQSKTLAQAVIDGIKRHCNANFERFITQYRENEVLVANGQELEPITISFKPILSLYVEQNHVEDDVMGGTAGEV